MEKRGQVTLFIIIAIVIVAAVLLFILLRPAIMPTALDEAKIREIKSFVQIDMKDAVDSSIFIIGQSGGYYDQDIFYIEGIPIYYLDGKKYIPSTRMVEESLSSIILLTLTNITEPAINETFKDVELTFGKPNVIADIQNESISIEINWPITIKKGRSSVVLDKWTVEQDVRIPHVLNVSTEIIDIISKNPSVIPITELQDIEEKSGLEISVDLVADNMTIYRLEDPSSPIRDINFTFYFGVVS